VPGTLTAARSTCWPPLQAGRAWSPLRAEAGAKTNEIPMIITLLDGVDLDRAVVPGDALHCQRATASYLHGRGADFILPAKDNQPRLLDALDALPWRDVPVAHAATDRGHGRIETRAIHLMNAPGDLPFPHVSQAYLIERHVTALDGTPLSHIAVLGVTSLDATRASPPAIASLVHGQWAIESLHWLRDTLYREDSSTVRTRSGPRAMATLRNLAVGTLYLAGRHDTTEATRWASRNMGRPFTIPGLTSRSFTAAAGNRSQGTGQLSGSWTAPGAMPDSSPYIRR
jgi:predicted transposase YbfD/YdcC